MLAVRDLKGDFQVQTWVSSSCCQLCLTDKSGFFALCYFLYLQVFHTCIPLCCYRTRVITAPAVHILTCLFINVNCSSRGPFCRSEPLIQGTSQSTPYFHVPSAKALTHCWRVWIIRFEGQRERNYNEFWIFTIWHCALCSIKIAMISSSSRQLPPKRTFVEKSMWKCFFFFFFLKIASPHFSFSNHGQTTFRFKFDVHLNLTANVGLETAAAGYEKPECCDWL